MIRRVSLLPSERGRKIRFAVTIWATQASLFHKGVTHRLMHLGTPCAEPRLQQVLAHGHPVRSLPTRDIHFGQNERADVVECP